MDEQGFLDELRQIEAKLENLDSDKISPEVRMIYERLKLRSSLPETDDAPVEIKFSFPNVWSRRLFLALAERYGLRPYRYRGQRRTTVVLKVSQSFVDGTLWPEFERVDKVLVRHLSEVTDLFIEHVLSDDDRRATVRTQRIPSTAPNVDAGLVKETPAIESSATASADVVPSTSTGIPPTVTSTTSRPRSGTDRRTAARRKKKNRKRRRKRR
jgi:hypothetical protein